MRIVLEIGINEFLFENLSESDIVDLEINISRQQAIGTNNLSIEDETAFHNKIYEIAGDNLVLQFTKLMHLVFFSPKRIMKGIFFP